ncbi:MAG: hypothetical protein HYR88_01395, partial [Verrucomicrobia bacterium]|nr:hypothetical protein [Verrucomicrobiota bacterium]
MNLSGNSATHRRVARSPFEILAPALPSSARRASALVLLLACLGPCWVEGQTPLNDLVFSVGTTIRDAGNKHWSFVLVGAVDPDSLKGKRFGVYAKPGDAASAAPFTQRGTLSRQSDVGAINALLNQSVSLGENLGALSDTLNTILRRVPGIASQTIAEKVVTLLRQAETDASTGSSLGLLTVSHPGLRLCLGQAFAETIAGVTTYELRELNPASGVAGDVIGRVTIVPGAPVILPAPGKPFQVVTNHPDDHLLIKLRWGTPDELRRLSLLSYGFNVWRLPRAFAEAAGKLGLSREGTIVTYDSWGVRAAALVWWTLRVMGFDNVRVLDGGLKAWLAEGRPTEAGEVTPAPTTVTPKFRPELVRDVEA